MIAFSTTITSFNPLLYLTVNNNYLLLSTVNKISSRLEFRLFSTHGTIVTWEDFFLLPAFLLSTILPLSERKDDCSLLRAEVVLSVQLMKLLHHGNYCWVMTWTVGLCLCFESADPSEKKTFLRLRQCSQLFYFEFRVCHDASLSQRAGLSFPHPHSYVVIHMVLHILFRAAAWGTD